MLIGILFGYWVASADGHCSRTSKSPRRQKLSLGVLLPETFRKQFEPYIKLALYHVHSNPSILPDYCIDLMFKDTQVVNFYHYCNEFGALVQDFSGNEVSFRSHEYGTTTICLIR